MDQINHESVSYQEEQPMTPEELADAEAELQDASRRIRSLLETGAGNKVEVTRPGTGASGFSELTQINKELTSRAKRNDATDQDRKDAARFDEVVLFLSEAEDTLQLSEDDRQMLIDAEVVLTHGDIHDPEHEKRRKALTRDLAIWRRLKQKQEPRHS